MTWQPPSITVKFGPYFQPDPEEQTKLVGLVQAALGGGGKGQPLILLRTGVEKIAPIFGIENIDAFVEKLEQERDANAERELDAATAALDAEARAFGAGPNAEGKSTGSGGGGGRPASGQKPPSSGKR